MPARLRAEQDLSKNRAFLLKKSPPWPLGSGTALAMCGNLQDLVGAFRFFYFYFLVIILFYFSSQFYFCSVFLLQPQSLSYVLVNCKSRAVGWEGHEDTAVQERKRVSGIKLPPIFEAQQCITGYHGGFKQPVLQKNSVPQKSTSSNAISTAPSFDLFSKPADNAPIISSAFIFYLFLTLRLQWRKDPKEQQHWLRPSSEAMQAIWDPWSCAGLKCQTKAVNRRTDVVSRLPEHCLGKDAYTRDQSQLLGRVLLQCLWHSLGELQGKFRAQITLPVVLEVEWIIVWGFFFFTKQPFVLADSFLCVSPNS